MPSYDAIINAFVTLMVTLDAPGLAPIFLALTAGMNRTQRYSVAVRSSILSLSVLIAFSLFGIAILDVLGITIHAFRVAGGLLLFYIAFEMIFGKRQERKEKMSETAITKDHIANVAVFPLAVPLTAGPGAISATILLSTQMGTDFTGKLVLALILAISICLVLLAFLAAELVDKFLGTTGRNVLTRLLGVLLAALSVQFVADGVKSLVT